LELSTAQGDKLGGAAALDTLASLARDTGDFARANALWPEVLTLAGEVGNAMPSAWTLHAWGQTALMQADYASARTRQEESLALFRHAGFPFGVAHALHNLGYAVRHLGDAPRAAACFAESVVLFRELGEPEDLAASLAGLAGVAVMRAQQLSGDPRHAQALRATRLLSAAYGVAEAIQATLWPAHRREAERTLAAAQDLLDTEVFAAAWVEGRAMTLEQAMASALDHVD